MTKNRYNLIFHSNSSQILYVVSNRIQSKFQTCNSKVLSLFLFGHSVGYAVFLKLEFCDRTTSWTKTSMKNRTQFPKSIGTRSPQLNGSISITLNTFSQVIWLIVFFFTPFTSILVMSSMMSKCDYSSTKLITYNLIAGSESDQN